MYWHLQEGGVVIPAGAVVYGQLVESPVLRKCSVSTSVWLSAPVAHVLDEALTGCHRLHQCMASTEAWPLLIPQAGCVLL